MSADNPDSKIVVLARDPIERVFSHYNWLRSLGIATQGFEEEISEWLGRPFVPETRFNGNFKNYVEFSQYGSQMQNLLNYFDREQVCFASLEEMEANKQELLDRIFRFLDIQSIDVSGALVVNETRFADEVEPATFSRGDEEWLFSLLQKEIELVESLGYRSPFWKTVNAMVGKA
jgi:hypothetical protein